MNSEAQINELNGSVKVRLALSPIHGIGVFAIQDIFKGQLINVFGSLTPKVYTVPYSSFSKLFPEVKALILKGWPAVINGSHFISPVDTTWHVLYMNHSDEPNFDNKTGHALKNIKAGDEITEDYRTMLNWETIHSFLLNK